MKTKIIYFIYISLSIVLWLLFVDGLYIMWSDNEMGLFMNYIFTSFGFVGMLWLNMIFQEKLIKK